MSSIVAGAWGILVAGYGLTMFYLEDKQWKSWCSLAVGGPLAWILAFFLFYGGKLLTKDKNTV